MKKKPPLATARLCRLPVIYICFMNCILSLHVY